MYIYHIYTYVYTYGGQAVRRQAARGRRFPPCGDVPGRERCFPPCGDVPARERCFPQPTTVGARTGVRRSLLCLINGPDALPSDGPYGSGTALIHKCVAADCQCGGSTKALATKLAGLLLDACWRSLPSVPVFSRWTKVVETLQWLGRGMVLAGGGVLLRTYKVAFGSRGQVPADMSVVALDEVDDGQQFHRVLRTRLQKAAAFLDNPWSRQRVFALLLVSAPMHFITCWLLAQQGRRTATAWSSGNAGGPHPVPLLDLQHPGRSPVRLARQYLLAA